MLRWVDNIKFNIKEIEWECVDWMKLAQNSVQWRAVVNAVISHRVAQMSEGGPREGHACTDGTQRNTHGRQIAALHGAAHHSSGSWQWQPHGNFPTDREPDTESSSVVWVEGGGIFLRSAATEVPDHMVSEHRT